MVWVVDTEEVDVHDEDAVLRIIFERAHFGRDVVLSHGPLDILDHAAPHLGTGGKLGIDATPFMEGEQAGVDAPPMPVADTTAMRSAAQACGGLVPDWGMHRCLVLPVDDDAPGRGRLAIEAAAETLGPVFDGLVIALSASVDCADRDQVWFHLLANVDPVGDRVPVGAGMGLDATIKRPQDATAARPVRVWPDVLPVR